VGRVGAGCGDVFFVFSAIMGKLGIIGVFQLWFVLVCFVIKRRLWDLEFGPMLLVSGLTLDKICNF
jgi:hypothetical protein